MQSNIDLLKSAVALHQQGRLEQAEQLYRQILETQPDHFDALHFWGVIAKQIGQPTQAINLISQAINNVKSGYNTGHASAFCNLGTAYQDNGQPQLALASFEQATKLKPDYAIAHSNAGNALKNLGRFDEALKAYQNALRIAPEYVEAYVNAAILLHQIGNHAAALEHLDRAIQIKPSYVDGYFARANVYQSLQKHELAVNGYDQAVALKPDFTKAYFNRGISQNRLMQFDQALHSFESAIAHQPDFANAHFYLANSLKQLNRKPEAIAAYQRAIALGADAEQIKFSLAALGVGGTPPAAPTSYIKDLFNQYADHFNNHLVDGLKYAVPQELTALIEKYRHQEQLTSLDLGCGTGLCGNYLKRYSKKLTGVDLSQNMLKQAARLKVYDHLICAELTEFLSNYGGKADLVVAADVLVYLGDLTKFFAVISHALALNGFLAFSVEDAGSNQSDRSYVLKESNRYAHSERYLRILAKEFDLSVTEVKSHAGRTENHQQIQTLLVLMQKITTKITH